MESFARLPPEERRTIFSQVAAMMSLPVWSVEKDFWVCWTLRRLFRLPEIGTSLTFKGGTSLSKAFHLIERFSEDIDIVIDRHWLGFGEDRDPERQPSRNQRVRRLNELRQVCREQVRERLLPAIEADFRQSLSNQEEWELAVDPNDAETILFRYPVSGSRTGPGYIQPVVRIETGARSDTWPSATALIQPFLSETIPDILDDAATEVRVIAPERTFWDKVTILHLDNERSPDEPLRRNLSRHAYDLWSLIRHDIGRRAMEAEGLFERVVEHTSIYFSRSGADYERLRRGSLRLAPVDSRIDHWRRDYVAMREMFFAEPPDFKEIVAVLAEFERIFNGVLKA